MHSPVTIITLMSLLFDLFSHCNTLHPLVFTVLRVVLLRCPYVSPGHTHVGCVAMHALFYGETGGLH